MAVNALPIRSSAHPFRSLGIIGMLGAPFLLLSLLADKGETPSHLGELFGLIFIGSSIFSVLGLYRMRAAGEKGGRVLLGAQIAVLCLATMWSVWQSITPGAGKGTAFFQITDASWPVSMLLMLISGITIAVKGRLQGWRRYIALACGPALPLTFLVGGILGPDAARIFFGSYVAVMWGLLGYSVFSYGEGA